MSDIGIDPAEIAGEVVEKALDSEPVRNLLGPLTANIGIVFGLVSDIARYYTEDNLERIFVKWANQRKGPPLDSESFKRVLPLLRDAAMQSDDELQDRWASLLENVATCQDGVLPSFGQTLSQLTPEEARYLDTLWDHSMIPSTYLSEERDGREALAFYTLRDIFDPALQEAPGPAEMRVHGDQMSEEQRELFNRMTKFELVLHDFERLSLLEKKIDYEVDSVRHEIGGEVFSVPSARSGIRVKYALTQYAVNFIQAVRPSKLEKFRTDRSNVF